MNYRLDAADSAFVKRQLEFVNERMFLTDYPAIKWSQFVPMGTSVSPGAETYKYQEMDIFGESKVADTYSGDAPLADVKVTETASKIVPVLQAYEYDIQDIRNAQFSGMDLDARKAMAARELLERKLDALVALGSADHGIAGFLNNASVPSINAATVSGDTLWSGKTITEKLKDIVTGISTILENTKGSHGEVVDLILAPKQFLALQLPLDSTTITGLQFMQASVPAIRSVGSWSRLTDMASGNKDRMVIYSRDPLTVEAVVPLRLNVLPPEPQGFIWRTNMEARCGGTVFYKPKSALYVDGL